MEYKQKYLKYKAKYLALKNQIGGGRYLEELIRAYNAPNPGKAVVRIPRDAVYDADLDALKSKLTYLPNQREVILTEICRIDPTNTSGLCPR